MFEGEGAILSEMLRERNLVGPDQFRELQADASGQAGLAARRGRPRLAHVLTQGGPLLRASGRWIGAWSRRRPCCALPAGANPANAVRCAAPRLPSARSEEHTSELQSLRHL